ncbi:MAG: hypothetical protein R3335_14180, partial [Anaerolineales bacterium]|nr:hypothetical protein [Anaerolineales bacterium]
MKTGVRINLPRGGKLAKKPRVRVPSRFPRLAMLTAALAWYLVSGCAGVNLPGEHPDQGAASLPHFSDVTDEAGWQDLMADIGPVDGLVTSAGVRTRSAIVDTTLEEWEHHLRINLT